MLLDTQLFSSLKTEYLFFLQNFQTHITSLKTNILNLEKLQFNLVDQFFSRKATSNNHNKNFSCTVCGNLFSTSKTLQQHLKLKHNNNNK
jgi:hypothetical protein